MKLHRKAIADFIWECVFAIAALRWRHVTPPPAKPYSQADAVATSITNLKGAKP
jgi:hypothetical protein